MNLHFRKNKHKNIHLKSLYKKNNQLIQFLSHIIPTKSSKIK